MSPAPAATVRCWPGMRSEHAVLPPHDGTTATGADQIGISFSAHPAVHYALDGRRGRTAIRPGAAVVSGRHEITWLAVREPTEALEIYPDPALVAAAAAACSSRPVDTVAAVGVPDGVVLAAGTVLRQAHVGATDLTDVEASTIAHRLAAHLVERYGDGAGPRPRHAGRLDPHTVDRVVERIEAGLGGVLTLDALAEVARLSPFHFARTFRATTGLTPHALVSARRMDRARTLLGATALPVAEVAARVGFSNVGHFRRLFVRQHGVGPGALRPTAQDRTL